MDLCIIMDEVRGTNGGIDADEFLKKLVGFSGHPLLERCIECAGVCCCVGMLEAAISYLSR